MNMTIRKAGNGWIITIQEGQTNQYGEIVVRRGAPNGRQDLVAKTDAELLDVIKGILTPTKAKAKRQINA